MFATGGAVHQFVGMREQGGDARIVLGDEILPGITEIPHVHAMTLEVGIHPLLCLNLADGDDNEKECK